MKEKRRLRRIKVGCKILDTHTEHTRRTHTHTHTRTVVLDDLMSLLPLLFKNIYISYNDYMLNCITKTYVII